MEFVGEVWFRFGSTDVWQFYLFVRELASRGATVALEWKPLPVPHEQSAQLAFLSLPTPEARGRFLHAMLGLVHLEDQDPGKDSVVARALAEAGDSVGHEVPDGRLRALAEEADSLGVGDVPALYRHGPVTRVLLNPASREGDVVARARAMLAVMDDDGVWGLQKP